MKHIEYQIINKKISVNYFVIITMIIDFVSIFITSIYLISSLISKNMDTIFFRIILSVFIISCLYGILSEFIFNWNEKGRYVLDVENEKIKHFSYQYDILPIVTNKTTSKLDLKNIQNIQIKNNKIFLKGDFVMQKTMQKPKVLQNYCIKSNSLNYDDFLEISNYLKKYKEEKGI